MRARDSSGQMGEAGGWSGRGERSVVDEVEEVLVRRLEGEELQRHIVGEEDRGEGGRAVRGETGMARVSMAPRPLGERCNTGKGEAGEEEYGEKVSACE